MSIINTDLEHVPVNELKQHPNNVNQGDFGAILESVQQNGLYGALVANRRTGHILAGNHRYAVAKHLGYETVPVAWVDVDPEKEIRIMLADNRTTRLGMDDESALADLLTELATTDIGLMGTGYDGDFLDNLLSFVGDGPGSVAEYISPMSKDEDYQAGVTGRQIVLVYTVEEYDKIIEQLEAVRNDNGFDSFAQVIAYLLER